MWRLALVVMAACGNGGGNTDGPGGPKPLPAYTVFVGNEIGYSITAFDLATRTPREFADVPGGGGASELAIDAAGRLVLVNGNDLFTFDGDGTIIGRFEHESGARSMALDGNLAYLTYTMEDAIAVVDLDTMTLVERITVGDSPLDIAIDPVARRAIVVNPPEGAVSVIDLDSRRMIDKKPIASNPRYVSVDPNTHRAFVSRQSQASEPINGFYLQVLDATTGAAAGQVSLNGSITGIYANLVDPVRERIYVVGGDRDSPFNDDSLAIIDERTLTVRTTVRAVGKGPKELAIDPATGLVFVASANSDDVAIVDPDGTIVGRVPTGLGPWAITISAEGVAPVDAGPGNDAPRDAPVDAITCPQSVPNLGAATCGSQMFCSSYTCDLQCNGTSCICKQDSVVLGSVPQGASCATYADYSAAKLQCACFH